MKKLEQLKLEDLDRTHGGDRWISPLGLVLNMPSAIKKAWDTSGQSVRDGDSYLQSVDKTFLSYLDGLAPTRRKEAKVAHEASAQRPEDDLYLSTRRGDTRG